MLLLSQLIEYQRPSKKRISPGDIFCVKLKDGPFVFGRVVRTDVEVGLAKGEAPIGILVYIYNKTDSTPKMPISGLSKDELLLPPIITNRQGWLKGAFQTIASVEVAERDRFQRHCFKTRLKKRPYVDEFGTVVDEPFEPCGVWGGTSFIAIIEDIADALSHSVE